MQWTSNVEDLMTSITFQSVEKWQDLSLLLILRSTLQSAAATYSQGFVICFLKVPLACMYSCSTAQWPGELSDICLQKLWNKLPPQTERQTRTRFWPEFHWLRKTVKESDIRVPADYPCIGLLEVSSFLNWNKQLRGNGSGELTSSSFPNWVSWVPRCSHGMVLSSHGAQNKMGIATKRGLLCNYVL